MLILEDHSGRISYFKSRYPEAIIVEHAKDAIEIIENSAPKIISLDHDLNGLQFVDSSDSDCGMEVVRWLVSNDRSQQIEEVIIHTANRKASELMVSSLREAGYNTTQAPFGGAFDDR